MATPYLVDRASQPDPAFTAWPAQVAAAGDAVAPEVVVAGTEVTGGAGSYVGTALIVKSRSCVLQISATSWSWSTR